MWSYTQARHRMIAENVANWGNPNYKTKQLDTRAFQSALREALDNRGSDVNKPFEVPATEQFRMRANGTLEVTPTELPAESILQHDGSNMSIEEQMADLAENAMMHETVTTLLRGRFDGLRKAIAGRL
jgi:flagellar basal-body rod protein FlgB